jgi:hypothetical protein
MLSNPSGEALHRRARRWQIPRGRTTPISPGRKRPANPRGGAGRGCSGEYFAQGGDGGSQRRWPEWPGDGGGDPDRQRAREGEGRASEGWAGSVDRPRPEPIGLAEPGGPDGPAGQLGQAGLGKFC